MKEIRKRKVRQRVKKNLTENPKKNSILRPTECYQNLKFMTANLEY